jgi:hypothetical protein
VPHSGHHRQQDCRRPDGTKRVADRTWRWPRRSRGHRALRLFAAVGTIAGGLSLVLAGTELTAELGQREPGTLPAAGRTVASYGGKRTEHPKEIPIPGPGLYRIAWSFRCAPGRSGEFVLEDRSASGSSNTEVTAAGQHRQGIWSGHVRAGRSLYIASGCAWQAHIVVPAHASTANPPPGHSGAHKHHANTKKHVGKKHSSTGRPHKKKAQEALASEQGDGGADQRADVGARRPTTPSRPHCPRCSDCLHAVSIGSKVPEIQQARPAPPFSLTQSSYQEERRQSSSRISFRSTTPAIVWSTLLTTCSRHVPERRRDSGSEWR